MEKSLSRLIFGMFIGIVIGFIIGYLIFGFGKIQPDFRNGNFGGNNFNLNEGEIISFFDSSPTELEIQNYCNENPMQCIYYCNEINSELYVCSQIDMPPMGSRP